MSSGAGMRSSSRTLPGLKTCSALTKRGSVPRHPPHLYQGALLGATKDPTLAVDPPPICCDRLLRVLQLVRNLHQFVRVRKGVVPVTGSPGSNITCASDAATARRPVAKSDRQPLATACTLATISLYVQYQMNVPG
jgi:hypothetical protein